MEASIAELVRVLEPGGRILIEEPDLTLLAVKLVAVAEKLLLMESHFRTPEAIGAVMKRCTAFPPQSAGVAVSAPGSQRIAERTSLCGQAAERFLRV